MGTHRRGEQGHNIAWMLIRGSSLNTSVDILDERHEVIHRYVYVLRDDGVPRYVLVPSHAVNILVYMYIQYQAYV